MRIADGNVVQTGFIYKELMEIQMVFNLRMVMSVTRQ